MATLQQLVEYTITGLIGETSRKIGERQAPTLLTVNGQVWDSGNFPVADNFGQATIWQTGNGGLTAPSYIFILSTADLIVELANTTPNPDERMLFRVAANALCVIPSSIMGGYASNTSRLDGAALVSGTDYNTITEIRVQRDAATGAGAASVRIILLA